MSTNTTLPSSVTFHDTEIQIIDRDGNPWVRGYQIGTALGYSNPDVAIRKVFDRNADEFTSEMTALVEMDTAGGRQQVRIFSPRGCHLVAMLSRTDRSKEFRRWVLDVLDQVVTSPASVPSPTISPAQQNARPLFATPFDFVNAVNAGYFSRAQGGAK